MVGVSTDSTLAQLATQVLSDHSGTIGEAVVYRALVAEATRYHEDPAGDGVGCLISDIASESFAALFDRQSGG